MKKFAAVAAACILGGSLMAKEVKIGVVMPMSGAIGGFGQSAWKGIELQNELTPTLKNGDTVKLILVDNKSDKIESANAMEKLVSSDKVTAVIGALTSTNTLAMTKMSDTKKVPMVAPVATNVRVTKNKEYVSRVCFTDDFQGVVGANFGYKNLKARTAAVMIDSKQDYSIGLAKAFEKQFKQLGGKVVKKTIITGGDKDFKAQLSAIKSANPDMVYIPIYSNEAALIALQSMQLGLKMPFVGGDGIGADKVFFEAGKGAVEGYMATDYFSPDAQQTASGEVFAKAYDKKYGGKVHTFAAMSADAYNVIVSAMNQCSNPSDSQCVNKNIRSTKNFEGVSGVISLENGNAIRSAVINEVKDGKFAFRTVVNP